MNGSGASRPSEGGSGESGGGGGTVVSGWSRPGSLLGAGLTPRKGALIGGVPCPAEPPEPTSARIGQATPAMTATAAIASRGTRRRIVFERTPLSGVRARVGNDAVMATSGRGRWPTSDWWTWLPGHPQNAGCPSTESRPRLNGRSIHARLRLVGARNDPVRGLPDSGSAKGWLWSFGSLARSRSSGRRARRPTRCQGARRWLAPVVHAGRPFGTNRSSRSRGQTVAPTAPPAPC
jgi:hypothetical protein